VSQLLIPSEAEAANL